jgi:hypothetical protein
LQAGSSQDGAASQQLVSQHDRFAQSRANRPGFLQHGSQLSQQVGAASQHVSSQHAFFAQSRASRPGFLQQGSQLSQQTGAASQQVASQPHERCLANRRLKIPPPDPHVLHASQHTSVAHEPQEPLSPACARESDSPQATTAIAANRPNRFIKVLLKDGR